MAAQAQQTAPQVNVQQANAMARQVLLDRAQDMWSQIFQNTYTSGIPGLIINVPVRNVGLIKRFKIEIAVTVAQGASETQTLTQIGPANILSNIVLTDLSNQQRINTTGWHMHFLATARRQWAYGSAYASDSPVGIGSNFPVMKLPATVTTSVSGKFFYEIPVSYSDYDLRGAIFANVYNATMNLQLTVNPNFFVTSTADPTLAVYKSSSSQLGTISSITITVHQNYLDQIPQTQSGPVLPVLDLSTAYLINNTSATGLVVGQDFPLPYSNFRQFMSTFAIYDNNGSLNAGTDINYFAIQSANYVNLLKYDPFMASLLTREMVSDDFPVGCYYFDHRKRPIQTNQYGNMQLLINPSTVNSGASVLLGYEALALISVVTQAGSLYGN